MIKLKIAVYALAVNDNNEILIVQRAPHDTHPNLWELPGGGVTLGEHPEKAIMRELVEETGLSATVLYPIAILNGHSSKDPSVQVIRIAYYCKINGGNQSVILSSEHTNFRWITLDQLPQLEFSDIFEEVYKKMQDFPQLMLNG